jgi:S-adenosylmethionine hydrolase
MRSTITLTSDFGLCDSYVAAMKGVILSINPEVNLIDICHTIEPQNINQASFIIGTAARYFPPDAIHLVVVDPGVGTKRPAVIVKTPFGCFVTPDNGSLSYVLQPYLVEPVSLKGAVSIVEGFKPDLVMEAVRITNSRFWRASVSTTFHGRDIFAPVAAALSMGESLESFGERAHTIEMLPLVSPERHSDGSLTGNIIHIDGFGNLITNILLSDIRLNRHPLSIRVGGELINGLSRTYSDGSGLLAYIGSNGYLEIALHGGSAGSVLNAKVGDEVKLSG